MCFPAAVMVTLPPLCGKRVHCLLYGSPLVISRRASVPGDPREGAPCAVLCGAAPGGRMLRGHLLWVLWWEVSFRTFSPDSRSYFHKTRIAHLHHYFIERCLCQVKKKLKACRESRQFVHSCLLVTRANQD